MKSRVQKTYIELPLKVFLAIYPQYNDRFEPFIKDGSLDINDSTYVVRMQTKNNKAIIEYGYESDAEWRIGKKDDKKATSYSIFPDLKVYQSLTPEQKTEYVTTINEFVESEHKKNPTAEIFFDEETGKITYKSSDEERT